MTSEDHPTIQGRCVGLEGDTIVIRSESGIHRAPVGPSSEPRPMPGDIVEYARGKAKVLTPNRSPGRSARWMESTLDPRRLRAISIRERVEDGIRGYFRSRGFRETRTPLLVPSPGMEPHIRPFRVVPAASAVVRPQATARDAYLPTSPEFAMKRLLAGGLERIFQLAPAFRDEPCSTTHQPEFTMLEWYRAYAGYEDIMADTERLLEHLALELFGKASFNYQGREISVATPWPRLRVRDLFAEHAGIELARAPSRDALAKEARRLGLECSAEDTWDDVYFRVWLNVIEPRLPERRAVFVTRYPASQAALAVVDEDPDGTRWARRFEAYAGGIELGNAFEELTDPVEQRRRFVEDMELRARAYGPGFPASPLDEGFLGALAEGMPPSGGIAVGVDRLVMLLADEPDIRYTTWLPYED